jgi:hypothetical protein
VERFHGLKAFDGRRFELYVHLAFARCGTGYGGRHGGLKRYGIWAFLRKLQLEFGRRGYGTGVWNDGVVPLARFLFQEAIEKSRRFFWLIYLFGRRRRT